MCGMIRIGNDNISAGLRDPDHFRKKLRCVRNMLKDPFTPAGIECIVIER